MPFSKRLLKFSSFRCQTGYVKRNYSNNYYQIGCTLKEYVSLYREAKFLAIFNFPAASFQIQVLDEQFRSSRVVALRCSKYRIKVLMKHNWRGAGIGIHLSRTFIFRASFPAAIQRNDYYKRKRPKGPKEGARESTDTYYQRTSSTSIRPKTNLQLRLPSFLAIIPHREVLMATTFVAANESK